MIMIEELTKFIWNHKYLMRKPVTGHSNGIDYINLDYDALHPLYGVCHRASSFYLYLKNGPLGPDGPVKLVQQRIKGVRGLHTYCYDTYSDIVVDLTSAQLPDDWDAYNIRNIGSTLTRYSKWGKTYSVQVPSNTTLMLGRLWKEQTGSAEGIQYWLNEQESTA